MLARVRRKPRTIDPCGAGRSEVGARAPTRVGGGVGGAGSPRSGRGAESPQEGQTGHDGLVVGGVVRRGGSRRSGRSTWATGRPADRVTPEGQPAVAADQLQRPEPRPIAGHAASSARSVARTASSHRTVGCRAAESPTVRRGAGGGRSERPGPRDSRRPRRGRARTRPSTDSPGSSRRRDPARHSGGSARSGRRSVESRGRPAGSHAREPAGGVVKHTPASAMALSGVFPDTATHSRRGRARACARGL